MIQLKDYSFIFRNLELKEYKDSDIAAMRKVYRKEVI